MPRDPQNSGNDSLELTTLLAQMSAELSESASRCTALQWSISTLLDKVHHPDLGEEIHMLQDIDRLQQTLVDISNVIRVAAELPSPIVVARDRLSAAIRLESFRHRIGLATEGTSEACTTGTDDADITWL